jgi:hypothetical protein
MNPLAFNNIHLPHKTMTEKQEPKKRKIPYLRLMLLFALIITLVVIYMVCIYTPPLRISVETTRITSPLTTDGQVDFSRYAEEITYPPEMMTDENGFRIFVQTFGDYGGVASHSEFCKEQRYQKLGLDRTILPTMVFPADPQSILSKLDPTNALGQRVTKLWTLEDVPMLTAWITDADVPLDAAAEMIRKPVFFFPYLQEEESARSGKLQNLLNMLIPDLQTCRQIANAYQTRATYRIGTGDIDGAIDDEITIHQLGRKIRQGGPLVQMLVGHAIEKMANSVPIAANPNHQPTKEQLQRILNAIDQLPLPAPIENSIEFERLFVLSVVQEVFHTGRLPIMGVSDTANEYIANTLCTTSNQNVVFRDINKAYDELIKEGKWSETNFTPFAMQINFMNLLTSYGRGQVLAEILCKLFMPAMRAAEEAVHQMECMYNMKHLILALHIYKAEHGEFPKEDWIENIKPYLDDKIEQYLRCPSCPIQDAGKTNYALVLYDNLPTNLDTLLLVELNNPVAYKYATVTIDDVLLKINNCHYHSGYMGNAKQSGAIKFIGESEKDLKQLLGLETNEE